MAQSALLPVQNNDFDTQCSLLKSNVEHKLLKLQKWSQAIRIHSVNKLNMAGFKYSDETNGFRCEKCNLEISDLDEDTDLLTVHTQRSPNCEHVQRCILNKSSDIEKTTDSSMKRQKTKSNFCCTEVKKLQEIRHRTFSHWPVRLKTFTERLILAGFFGCNVGDRVICLYCNLICQQWNDLIDDPNEVHQSLSPNCIFVTSVLKYPVLSSTIILNDVSTDRQRQFNEIVQVKAINERYSDMTKRIASFESWSQEAAPSIEDFVRAGFFYTGTRNIVTCFYCNGSLQNWAAADNPMIEHARWFSHCPYAKQMCGDQLYQRIQVARRARQEQERVYYNQNEDRNHGQLITNDQNMLSRLVAARLDLPESQNLLDQGFKLSVIKRCWEDQLKLKNDDFISSTDLFVACVILQKQIDHINGNKENIIVPSVRTKLIREEQSDPTPVPMEIKEQEEQKLTTSSDSTVTNPCIICFQDEKRLACLPCGHFSACVPCSHSLRTCPVCRREIEAFVRVYI